LPAVPVSLSGLQGDESLEVAVGSIFVYVFKRVAQWARARGSDRWASASATITAPPIVSFWDFRQTVEVVYSYRFEGELYTGIHVELFLFGRSLVDCLRRTIWERKPVSCAREAG
jgi:hypothetical protein